MLLFTQSLEINADKDPDRPGPCPPPGSFIRLVPRVKTMISGGRRQIFRRLGEVSHISTKDFKRERLILPDPSRFPLWRP